MKEELSPAYLGLTKYENRESNANAQSRHVVTYSTINFPLKPARSQSKIGIGLDQLKICGGDFFPFLKACDSLGSRFRCAH